MLLRPANLKVDGTKAVVENLEVFVDFTGAIPSENNKDFPARVVLNTGSNTFVIGNYKVNAIVGAVTG